MQEHVILMKRLLNGLFKALNIPFYCDITFSTPNYSTVKILMLDIGLKRNHIGTKTIVYLG